MSGPINAVAILDSVVRDYEILLPEQAPQIHALAEAVAELIEAAKSVAEHEDEPRFIYGSIARLRAALARLAGAPQ